LALIACSTWLNETSCWVNWLVSSGESGSWFLSCVVSSVRKVLKSVPNPVVDVGAAGVGFAAALAARVEAMDGVVMACAPWVPSNQT